MLGKLIKHELIATGRVFMLLYASVIAFAALTSLAGLLLSPLEVPDFVWVTLVPLFVLGGFTVLAAVTIMPLVIIAVRFYRSFLGSEGYLMFTLPVTRHELLLSRLIVAVVWQTIALIVAVVSVVIALAGWIPTGFWADNMWYLQPIFTEMLASFDRGGFVLAMTFVSMVLSSFSSALMIYLAMGLGQLANSHRVLLSFTSYIGLWVATTIVAAMITFPITFSFALNDSMSDAQIFQETTVSLVVGNVMTFVLCIAMYFATEYLLRKRLNLL